MAIIYHSHGSGSGEMAELKLQALDAEDLAVISAHCQDAVVRSDDLAYSARDRRFALVCNRFDRMAAPDGPQRGPFTRRRAGVRFEYVTRAQSSGLGAAAADGVLVLLAMTFTPTDEPAGLIELQFAGGASIRLDVECIEAELRDLAAAWSTSVRPDHPGSDNAAETTPPAPK